LWLAREDAGRRNRIFRKSGLKDTEISAKQQSILPFIDAINMHPDDGYYKADVFLNGAGKIFLPR